MELHSGQFQAVLAQLDDRLRKGAVANADDVMKDLKVLQDANLVVPQTFYIEALRLFTSRKDITRTELLLRMSQQNLSIGLRSDEVTSSGSSSSSSSSRSRPLHDTFHKLVSFSVTGLLREGCFDDAMTLLVRMSSAGYVTSRVSLEKMLDRIASSGKICPSIAFIDKINQTMTDNRWNRAPGFYVRLFKVIRQHILWSCTDRAALDGAADRLDALWLQATTRNEDGASADIELLSIRIQCLLLVVRMHRKMGSPDELVSSRLRQISEAFRHMLQVGQSIDGSKGQGLSNDKLDEAMASEIRSLIADLDVDGLFDFDLYQLFATRKGNAGQHVGGAEGLNHAWSRQNGQLRNAVANLSVELAQSGSLDEAVLIVELFLENTLKKEGREFEGVNRKLEAVLSGKVGHGGIFSKARISLNNQNSYLWNSTHKDWAERLVSNVLSASGVYFARHEGDLQTNITAFANRLKEAGAKYELSTKAPFYAAWIDALYSSRECATKGHLIVDGVGRASYTWQKALGVASKIIDSVDESVGRSPLVYHALVSLLCRYEDPSAVARVRAVFLEMTAEGTKVLPETLATYMNSAILCVSDEELSNILLSVEELVSRSEDLTRDPTILAARLRANARLCRGHKSLELLRDLRHRKSETNLGSVERHVYSWVISALYLSWPGTDAEWRIAADPQNTCEYILQEMLRDGHYSTPGTVAQLLKLYSKACQMNRKRSTAVDSIITGAEEFLQASIAGGNVGHPKVVASESCIRELVKACCLAGQEERALAIIDNAEVTYGLRPKAACWEPLVFYYAYKQGAMNAAEDVLTMMTNRGVALTDAITDAFVAGHLKQGDASEALDRVQDIYNQHGVRPAPGTLLNLLQSSLDGGDVFEAKRVCSVVRQMYTPAEREMSAVWTPTTARALGVSYSETSRSEQAEGGESIQEARDVLDSGARYTSSYRLRAGGTGPAIQAALSDSRLAYLLKKHGLE